MEGTAHGQSGRIVHFRVAEDRVCAQEHVPTLGRNMAAKNVQPSDFRKRQRGVTRTHAQVIVFSRI